MKRSIRCSELDRVLNCNGSVTLVPLVDPREGDEGVAGTNIHAKIAWMLVSLIGAYSGEPIAGKVKPLGFDEWIADYCFREVRDSVPPDWSLEVETGWAYEFANFILSGHMDAVAISPDATEAIGWDYKTGYDPVDPAEFNEQVLGYIVLLKRAYPTLRKITFKIVQPRNDEDEGFERVSSVTVNFDHTDIFINEFEMRMDKALSNPMELDTGRKQCRWCPVGFHLQCPALKLQQENMKLTMTKEALANIKRAADDKTLGDWVIAARTLKPISEAAEETLHARLDKQPSIVAGDGTTITRSTEKGSYSWPNRLVAFQAIKEVLPKDESLAKVLTPSVKAIKAEIATTMNIPQTGISSITAEKVFDAKIRAHCEQGTRRLLVFTR